MGLLLGLLIFYLCFACGRRVLEFLNLPVNQDELIVFGAALGLSFLAYGVLLLGLAHFLTPGALWGLLALFAAASAGFHQDTAVLKAGLRHWFFPFSGSFAAVTLFSLITLGAVILGVLAPETANDSLCYHLNLPKVFLQDHSIGILPYKINTVHPIFMEMLYTLGLALQGAALAKSFHFFTGLLTAGAILIYLRRYVKIQFAWIAALLFLTTPGITSEMGTTYVEVGLACYATLALIAVLRWLETQHRAWLALAGALAGCCLSIKYLGAIPMMSLSLILFFGFVRGRGERGKRMKGMVIFFSVAVLFSGYWYLRNAFHFGNPVYPYFHSMFKIGDPDIHHYYDHVGVKKSAAAFLKLPWTMTMHPKVFEGYGDQIGPAYLAFLPAILLGPLSVPFSGWLLFSSFFYVMSWFFLGQILRFIFFALPPLAILIGAGLSRVRGRFYEFILKGLLVLIFLLHAGVAVYHYRNSYPVALGMESPDHYLLRVERTYEGAQFANKNLSSGSKILFADETHLFYFNPVVIRDIHYAQDTRYDQNASPEAIVAKLRSDGFTHILFTESNARADGFLPGALRIPRMIAGRRPEFLSHLKQVYAYDFRDLDGLETHYKLYAIKK